MLFTDLTAEQRCVLLNAVEESYLFDVLTECGPGTKWPEDRLAGIPHMARVVADFIEQGLVCLTRDAEEDGKPPTDIPADQAHEILADPANWWFPEEGARPYALAVTGEGRAVYRARAVPDPAQPSA